MMPSSRETVSYTHLDVYKRQYMNRLSDFLFVAARSANDNGSEDVLWVPGQNR